MPTTRATSGRRRARGRQSGQGEDETGNREGAGHDPILSVGSWRPGASLLQESASLSRNDEDPDTELMRHSPGLAMGPDPRSPRMAASGIGHLIQVRTTYPGSTRGPLR